MRVLLRDLAPGQEYAVQFRSNTGEAVSEWSHVTRFTTTNDTIPPSQPTNLAWYDSGSSFIGQWDKVTTQASTPPTPLNDFRHYRINISSGADSVDVFALKEYIVFSKEENIAAFGTFKSSLTIKVYAVDNTYNESLPISATVDPRNPPVPSAPTLKPYFGSLLVEWDGKDSAGVDMPDNLDYAEVHVGTTVSFTPSASTLHTRLYPNQSATAQRALLSGLENGDYYVRLIAVNLARRKSNVSAASNMATRANLTGLDIAENGIKMEHINFTARDLGGANAFYGTTEPQVGVNGVTVIEAGDIWYDTNVGVGGGKTYRYDGSVWVEDSTIGVISGKKILTNTLTADAVGTNLLLTNKANIAEALIDDAHIDFLNANKIKAGVLESTFQVNYGGVYQPAFSFDMNGNAVLNNIAIKGQAVVGSSTNTAEQNGAFAVRSYNYVKDSAGWTINGDGSVEFAAATIRGIYKTASTGRRIEMGSSVGQGILRFYNGTNDTSQWIRSLLWENQEILQFRGGQESLVIATSVSNIIGLWGWEIQGVMRDAFTIWSAAGDQLGEATTPKTRRFYINKTETAMIDERGTTRLSLGQTSSIIRDWDNRARIQTYTGNVASNATWINGIHSDNYIHINGDTRRIVLQTSDGRELAALGNGEIHMNYGSGLGSHRFQPGNQNVGGQLFSFSGSGHGNKFFLYQDGRGTWWESQYWDGSSFAGIRASAFEVNSDERSKNDILDVEESLLAQVNGTKVKKYKRKQVESISVTKTNNDRRMVSLGEDDENQPPQSEETVNETVVIEPIEAPVEIGLIAQEAPSQIVSISDDGSQMSIDLYQMTAMIWGAVQELSAKVEVLESNIKRQGKGK